MRYYFDLFNNENNHNYIIYEEQEYFKTNMPFFNLRFSISELTRDKVEVCNLIIEKEIDGNYIFNNKSLGIINDDNIYFKNVEFKNLNNPEEKYRIYFEVKYGGIVTFTSKNKAITFLLNTKAFDFDLILGNSILLNDIYELQGENIEEINFEIITKKNRTFQYFYSIDYNEKISPSTFQPLDKNIKKFSSPININSFRNNITFLHFFIKDNFENIKYKKIKITTKNGSLSILSILNKEIKLSSVEEEFGLFFEARNITQITPVINYFENGEEKTKVGRVRALPTSKSIVFNLSSEFEELNTNIVFLFFLLNNDDKLTSNMIAVNIDKEKPEIILPNYKIVSDKYKNRVKLEGKIIDNNFFFLGENIKVINPINNILLINSENNELNKIRYNDTDKKLLKYSNYYYCEFNNENFQILDRNNREVNNLTFLNSFEERKHFYIWLDKNKLTLFEKNILENQGEFKLVGNIENYIIEQEQIIFDNLIILKIVINENTPNDIQFDVQIGNFEYSFLYYINNSNISCELNNKKELITSFTKTNALINKSEISEIIKFNNKKSISEKIGVFNGFINFLAVSYNTEEFALKGNIIFLDEALMLIEQNGRRSASGFITRNPTNFNTSQMIARIVEVTDEQIKNSEFLNQAFPAGRWYQANKAKSTVILGLKTLLSMYGDYDGDNTSLSVLSKKDFKDLKDGSLKIRDLKRSFDARFNLLNIMSRGNNVFKEIRETDLENSNFEGLRKVLVEHGKNNGMLNSNGEFTEGNDVDTLRKSFIDKHKLYIFAMHEELPDVNFRLQDEIEGLGDLAQPVFYKKISLGHKNKVEISNKFMQKIYDKIDAKTSSSLSSNSDDEIRLLVSNLLENQDLTSDEKEILKKFLTKDENGPKAFRETFSFENLMKTFKGKGTGFGVVDGAELKVNYTQNALTGLLDYKIHKNVNRALAFSEEHKLSLLLQELTKKLKNGGELNEKEFKVEDLVSFLGKEIGENFDGLSKEEIKKLSTNLKILLSGTPDGQLVEKVISSKHGAKGKFTPVGEIEKMVDDFFEGMFRKKLSSSNKKMVMFKWDVESINQTAEWFEKLRTYNVEGKVKDMKELKLTDLFNFMYKNDGKMADHSVRSEIISEHFKSLFKIFSNDIEAGSTKEFLDILKSGNYQIKTKNNTVRDLNIGDLAEALNLDLKHSQRDGNILVSELSFYFSGFINSVATEFEKISNDNLKMKNNVYDFISSKYSEFTEKKLRKKAEEEYQVSKLKMEDTVKTVQKESAENFEELKTENSEKLINEKPQFEENKSLKQMKLFDEVSVDESEILNEEKAIEETVENLNETINSNTDSKVENAKEVTDNILGKAKKRIKNIYNKTADFLNNTEETAEQTTETTSKIAEQSEKTTKKLAKNTKNKSILAGSIAVATIGSFLYLVNKNRTVVHLENRDQLNNANLHKNPEQSLQRRMGQYQIHTTIRDLF